MSARRELCAFVLALAALLAGFFGESLFGGKVLSPADVLFVSESFRSIEGPNYEPENRLLMDPVLQFQPWLEFNRSMIRAGQLPLWNDKAGCGTPHLANAQSAPFDPFNTIAYLGELPGAYSWMAFARLLTAGLGMFLLARSWGLGSWSRWFAGLSFPFCGFLVVWLLFPVTNAAIWLPWLFLASDGVFDRPSPYRVAGLAVVIGCIFLGGHIQTSAHILLAAGLYFAWRTWVSFRDEEHPEIFTSIACWAGGIFLGLTIASISIVPLWVYLGKSPVWNERVRERPSIFALTTPRLLDAVCNGIPYAFGSQRRGDPNLARALGVHNLNESAGGFAGLATLIWLAPQAWLARRRQPRVVFLVVLGSLSFLGAYGFAPVVNLFRAVPIFNVTDQRRLTLWLAFSLVLLGGIGLDHLELVWSRRVTNSWVVFVVGAALALWLVAVAIRGAEPWLASRAQAHYANAAANTEGADHATYQARAERQVQQTLTIIPRVFVLAGAELFVLVGLARLAAQCRIAWPTARTVVFGLTLVELLCFGYGLNPAIAREKDRPLTDLIKRLTKIAGTDGRILGIGQELPPNVAMRYGLADIRNYDSVELARSLDWFERLYEPSLESRSSRRTITWAGAVRAREALCEAGVKAIFGPTPPPADLNAEVERVGSIWIAKLNAQPLVKSLSDSELVYENSPGRIQVWLKQPRHDIVVIRQMFDPGWVAEANGERIAVQPYLNTFISICVPENVRSVTLTYAPPEVRYAGIATLAGLGFVAMLLSGLSLEPIRSISRSRSWKGQRDRVRIDCVILTGSPDRLITEGKDADGPLYV